MSFFNLQNKYWVWFCYASVTVIVLLTANNSFFWDTVQLASKHGTYYHSTQFSSLLLPLGIDSGHIPTFGMYIAAVWTVFGKSLFASHLAMLPFVLGIVFQLHRLLKRFVPLAYIGPALLVVLLDATLLGQITLVSPDVVLVFFFLMTANAVYSNRKWLIGIGVVCMFLVSMRGMMISVCLLLLDLYLNFNFRRKPWLVLSGLLKRSLIYLPALLVFIAFSIYHYKAAGWIGFHEDSPWAASFQSVDFKGFLRNVGILGWRLLDFGRVILWLVMALLLFRYRKEVFQNKTLKPLWLLLLLLLVLLPLNMLWATQLLGHRYLLPIFLIFAVATVSVLFSVEMSNIRRAILTGLCVVVLSTGNLWVYPEEISQGWDSTLGHLPYYELRKEAIAYMNEEGIELTTTESFFPNVAKFSEIDLSEVPGKFKQFKAAEEYVFYSNVYNLSDSEYELFQDTYQEIKRFSKGAIYVALYQRKR